MADKTRKVLIVGGDRHGEWVEVLVGASSWVDIRTGDTHRIASWRWAITDPGPDGVPVVTERYVLKLAIHPQVAAHPQSWVVVQESVTLLAVNALMREHAQPLPPDEQAVKAPDTPAGLFGPDGVTPL